MLVGGRAIGLKFRQKRKNAKRLAWNLQVNCLKVTKVKPAIRLQSFSTLAEYIINRTGHNLA
jgi:hypothetical protein